jgi:hypothetical protein
VFVDIGIRHPIQVGGPHFSLDLVFYSRALNCLAAFELMAFRDAKAGTYFGAGRNLNGLVPPETRNASHFRAATDRLLLMRLHAICIAFGFFHVDGAG